jgi:DNA-binding NarL/FixJ family response regulator
MSSSNNVPMVDGIEARDLRHDRADDADGRVTVMLAGEQTVARARVRTGLERDGFAVVAEVEDADEAVEAAKRFRPQLCLLDIDMPGGGITAADRISFELPDTRIALLSGSPQRDQLRNAILAGADGYLLRSTAPDRLTAALYGLVNGEAAFPRAMTGDLVREFRQYAPRSPEPFGPPSGFDSQLLPPRSRILYVPRLLKHYRRRRRSEMSRSDSWMSARMRMGDYE